MASPTHWTWVWVNFRSWWWTGRPGVLWFMGSQRVRHGWATELSWTELQHTKLPWPSLSPEFCPSSSATFFPFCLQSFPASGSFQMSQLFASGGQNIGSFSFNISPSNEYSGLISFRMDWLDLLAVQGTLKSLFQHHSSKASILRHSAFFIVQLSHPYTATGKTHSFD